MTSERTTDNLAVEENEMLLLNKNAKKQAKHSVYHQLMSPAIIGVYRTPISTQRYQARPHKLLHISYNNGTVVCVCLFVCVFDHAT